jgi:hypothetical protein
VALKHQKETKKINLMDKLLNEGFFMVKLKTKKPEYPKRTTNRGQASPMARTHAVLVIGLYEYS